MDNWINTELKNIDLNDYRLNKRAKKIFVNFNKQPMCSIPASSHSWAETKAAYRFFNNPKVTAEKILMPHKLATINRVKECKKVFLLQDTTELDYSSQKCKQDVGPSHYGNEKILFLHPSLLVNEQGTALGIYDDYQWFRQELKRKTKTRQYLANELLHKKHVSEKESYRWLLGYRHACEISTMCPDTKVIMIADREGDLYDLYDECEKNRGIKADWLIRAKITKRALLNEDNEKDQYLLDKKIYNLSPVGIIEFNLPKRNGESGRVVQQELRIARLTLHPPTGRRGKLRCSPVQVTVLLAKEINIPENQEPINWWLITSIKPEELQSPSDLIKWYLLRWKIEIFFRILKSGCKVEELQLENSNRLRPCLAMYLIIAWRILFFTTISQTHEEVKCNVILSEEEWKTAWLLIKKQKLPHKIPTIREMVIIIAKLGGYLARKSDSPPGPKAIWLGLTYLYHALSYNSCKNQEMYGCG